MVVKRAKYTIAKDEYHFQTDVKAIQILDRKKNLLGTVRELAYEGKVVTTGSFKDLKVSGTYRVKGLSDMPDNIPSDKECILAVIAVGKINEPDMVMYKLISPNGVIVENTVTGNTQSGWGTGGVNLQNTIKDINTAIGDIDKLKTDSKNVTDAINELVHDQQDDRKFAHDLDDRFKKHNHDARYLFKNGDTVNGDLSIKNEGSLKLNTSAGTGSNFAHMTKDNVFVLGDKNYDMRIDSNNLKLNGSDVLTQANIKSHKIDAATLNGFKDSDFIKKFGTDYKYGDLQMEKSKLVFTMKNGDDAATGLVFKDEKNQVSSKIQGNGVGDIQIRNRQRQDIVAPFQFNHDNNFVQYGGSHYIRSYEPGLNFQTWDEKTDTYDAGIGFFKPNWEKSSLAVGNWMIKEVIMQFGVHDGEAVKIHHSPYIGEHNRRLFMQDERPSGDVPYGSVWVGF